MERVEITEVQRGSREVGNNREGLVLQRAVLNSVCGQTYSLFIKITLLIVGGIAAIT